MAAPPSEQSSLSSPESTVRPCYQSKPRNPKLMNPKPHHCFAQRWERLTFNDEWTSIPLLFASLHPPTTEEMEVGSGSRQSRSR
ncbi:unnamed protein product [Linum trigynum]|uniref:Uncharacterized protein n=1 Tax=Linum trigynum TaxID=586398 RepID=A0AAV2E9L3_9ROSI